MFQNLFARRLVEQLHWIQRLGTTHAPCIRCLGDQRKKGNCARKTHANLHNTYCKRFQRRLLDAQRYVSALEERLSETCN